MASPNPRIDMLKAQAQHRKRSNSLEHLKSILKDCERFLPETPDRLSSLENMHSLLHSAESKRLRPMVDGSPAGGETLDRFFTDSEGGSLGLGYPEFHMDDNVTFMDYTTDHVKPEPHDEDPMVTNEEHHIVVHNMPQGVANQLPPQHPHHVHHNQAQPTMQGGNVPQQHHLPQAHHPQIQNPQPMIQQQQQQQHHQQQQQHHVVQHHHPIQQHHTPGLPPRPHPSASEPTPEQPPVPERRLSHKEVEQRRREKAKQYFDELRSLLPSAQDSKFDKNSILQNSIQLIKSLRNELSNAGNVGRGPTETSALSLEYRTVFNISRQCMAFAGLDGRIWEANQAFSGLLGYPREETTALTILSVTAREDSELSLQQGRKLLSREAGPCCSYNVRLVKKEGGYIHCTVELNLLERDNVPYCFLFSAHQIG